MTMNGTDLVQAECDVFLRNYALMLKDDFWPSDIVRIAAAGIAMAGRQAPDMERIDFCRRLMKARKGFFSTLRGTGSYVYIIKMAMSDDPEAYLEHLSQVHAMLKTSIFESGISVTAAMNIVDIVPPEQYAVIVKRTLDIYDEMKSAHWFMTSEEDMAFAALMAMTGDSPYVIHRKAEEIYGILKGTLRVHDNTIQTISHILSLYDGEIVPMCNMVVQLFDGLKEAGHAMDTNSTAVVLSTFAASRTEIRDLIMNIAAADDYLIQFKPFRGFFGQSARIRRMIAVLCVQRAENSADSGLSASVTAAVMISIVIRAAQAAAAAAA